MRSDVGRAVARASQPEDLTAVEVGLLLDEVRVALHDDFGAATRAAEQLAALLASKLSQDARSAPAHGGLAPWQRRKIEGYIRERLNDSLVVGDLANLISLSISHFGRAFKVSFGEAPHAYIIRARIERARMLMLTTSENLSQIALGCGLADQAHFCRLFRQVTGTTPGAWRRSHAIDP